jgi:hypothetical protein
MARISSSVFAVLFTVASLHGDQKKLTEEQRVEFLRGLNSEYATVKAPLPRSKKPLEMKSDGTYDWQEWLDIGKANGPAARVGDLVQITHVSIEPNYILFEINHGVRTGTPIRDRIQVGVNGGPSHPISSGDSNAPGGTNLVLRFVDPMSEFNSADVKKMLSPVLQFEDHSATGNYVDSLPPEIKQAIAEKKPRVGMDRDQVILAIGKPLRKSRESKDGVDYEDWIYGQPPGRVTFVTFSGAKVVKIKDTYAGLGGTIAETPKQP